MLDVGPFLGIFNNSDNRFYFIVDLTNSTQADINNVNFPAESTKTLTFTYDGIAGSQIVSFNFPSQN